MSYDRLLYILLIGVLPASLLRAACWITCALHNMAGLEFRELTGPAGS